MEHQKWPQKSCGDILPAEKLSVAICPRKMNLLTPAQIVGWGVGCRVEALSGSSPGRTSWQQSRVQAYTGNCESMRAAAIPMQLCPLTLFQKRLNGAKHNIQREIEYVQLHSPLSSSKFLVLWGKRERLSFTMKLSMLDQLPHCSTVFLQEPLQLHTVSPISMKTNNTAMCPPSPLHCSS